MATISAAEVNKLRQQTGSGMMDCKRALEEANGDFEMAIDILRKKGQKVAEKRSDREASEGYAVAKISADGSAGVILSLNCETDFVAKNAAFVSFAEGIAATALNHKIADKDSLLAATIEGAPVSISEQITEQIGKIGEKIEIGDFQFIAAETVVAYNHPGNQTASLVGLNQKGEAILTAGKDIAMQIAAMAPVALDKDAVPAELIEKELEIGKEIARQEGKPEEMLDKIAQGKLNKYFKESTLLAQDFIKENKMSVLDYLKSVNPNLRPTAFKRISLN